MMARRQRKVAAHPRMWCVLAALSFFCFVAPGIRAADSTHRDPICRIDVNAEDAYLVYEQKGETNYFSCKRSFEMYTEDLLAANKRLKIRSGWYPWRPYQYLETVGNRQVLNGLDVMLVRKIFANISVDVEMEEVAWGDHQAELKRGARDIASGAFYTPKRAKYAYFSKPYRQESNALYLRRGMSQKCTFKTIPEMLKYFEENGFRLGVVREYAYADQRINEYVAAKSGSPLIVPVDTEDENFDNLFADKIDGFLIDRIVGATIAWKNDWLGLVEEHPHILPSADIHVMFSKNTTSPALVDAFNASLDDLKKTGQYHELVRHYVIPVLLAQTIERSWFFNIDIIGTVAFAISGLILARKGKYDFFGAVLLGSLPAIGGGVMRDVLIYRRPVGVLRTPYYIYAIIATVTLGWIIIHGHGLLKRRYEGSAAFAKIDEFVVERFEFIVRGCDALGLAAFTIIGVVISVEARCHPLWIWGPILAAVTSSGGGILRDIVRGEKQITSIMGSFFPSYRSFGGRRCPWA